ncbi:MAG TPA: FkbM family methyltransferase [Myxococcota bacterium]|nr:FkbM family methyltransferase [Myxococcota bacterium]
MSAAELVNRVLRPLGVRLTRARPAGWRVGRAASGVSTLIDVGCAWGTPEFYATAPKAELFLVDPVAEYEAAIKRILTQRPGSYTLTALGAGSGTLELNVELDAPTRSSALARTELTRTGGRIERRRVPVTTLDALVERHSLRPPFGLKIDAEGYELEILRGAESTLRETRFVVAETSVQRRFAGSYRFLDLLQLMDASDFVLESVLHAGTDRAGVVRYLDLLLTNKRAA